ncbi:unnamed protein product, partial [Musa acuminata subsp. burmannicoides]
MPHLTTIVTRPVIPTASPTVPSAATASSLGAISGKMSHLTTVIASSTATATATTLVTIFGKMPSLTAIITSSATAIASAAPSPPTTVPPSPGSAATATSKPFSPTVAAAAAAAPLHVGSVGTGDVDGLDAAVVALGDHELDDLALSQGTVSFSLDGGLVDEEVLPAVVRRDETEPLGVVEPLHGSPRSVVRLLHRSGGSQPRDHRGNLNPHAKREKKRNPL